MITAKSWGPSEINLLPLQPSVTTLRWQLLETSDFEADPACPSRYRWVHGHKGGRAHPHRRVACTHLGRMLSDRHMGATAGLHGEAHDLAFHKDEQQHEDLDHSKDGGQAC